MGRKKKGSDLQDKIDKYLTDYELDDLNQSNDMQALTTMCQLELNIEKIQEALSSLEYKKSTKKGKETSIDTKQIRELHSALRDANQNWVQLQTELGINRRQRRSDDDETPLQHVMKIQDLARKFVDSRYNKVVCSDCGQYLGKYLLYVTEKGEEGSIESKTEKVEPYKHTFRVECWKCGKMVEDSNEDIVLTYEGKGNI